MQQYQQFLVAARLRLMVIYTFVVTTSKSLYARVRSLFSTVIETTKIRSAAIVSFALTIAMPAMAQSDTIEIDMAPFFENMNTYIPIFFSIFAIVGGIMAAMALSKLVINAVVGALSGRASF